jgi:hypothetical protein
MLIVRVFLPLRYEEGKYPRPIEHEKGKFKVIITL